MAMTLWNCTDENKPWKMNELLLQRVWFSSVFKSRRSFMVWITTTIKSQHFPNYTVCLQKMYYFRIHGLFLKAVNGAGLQGLTLTPCLAHPSSLVWKSFALLVVAFRVCRSALFACHFQYNIGIMTITVQTWHQMVELSPLH